MKNKVMMLNVVALLFASATFGQGVENDDMYFNSKDRVKLKAQKASEDAAYTASVKKSKKSQSIQEEVNNPTDSYSARNVNPEFAARSNSQVAAADNADYFVTNYRYTNASDLNNWNNNFNNWYSNPWYSANYFGPSINSWNSPYYGSYYDSWGNPWCNPYYRSGWSSSFSYYYGSSWNYGWGGGMGMSYGYGNPYMNSWSSWGPSFGYGYGYNSYYNNPTVVIINNGEGGRNVAYGKRATHGGAVTTRQEELQSRTRSNYVPVTSDGGRPNSGGRVATQTNQRQEDYYNRSWRNSQQTSTGTTSPSRSSEWSGNSGSSNTDTYNRQGSSSNSYNSGSRSSSYDGGGATRSSAPASSGSNGRTRGRD